MRFFAYGRDFKQAGAELDKPFEANWYEYSVLCGIPISYYRY
jgi:hypothetical protein